MATVLSAAQWCTEARCGAVAGLARHLLQKSPMSRMPDASRLPALRESIPGCVALGWTDLDTGSSEVSVAAGTSPSVLDLCAAAAAELLDSSSGLPPECPVGVAEEVLIVGTEQTTFLQRLMSRPRLALMVVTRGAPSLGVVLASVRGVREALRG